MHRFCERCQRTMLFFRLEGSKTVIYCSFCCRAAEVTEAEASWFQEDDPHLWG